MPVSVANFPANGGLSNLLRQARPAKSGDESAPAAGTDQASAALRQGARSTIDSTGSTSAQIKATLTLYLSPLAGQVDPATDKAQARPASAGTAATATRSGASDLLRVLDAYAADPLRLSA